MSNYYPDYYRDNEIELHCSWDKSRIADAIEQMVVDSIKDIKDELPHSRMVMRDWVQELEAIGTRNDGFHQVVVYVIFDKGPDVPLRAELNVNELVAHEVNRRLDKEMDEWHKAQESE